MCGWVGAAPRRTPVVHRVVFVAAVAFAVLPSTAAAGVRLESTDVVLPAARGDVGWRTLPAERAPFRFTMAAVHWQGPGRVLVRAAKAGGAWSPWRDAGAEGEDAPDPSSAEAHPMRGWRLGSPVWVGPSNRLQLSVAGNVRRARVFFIASRVTQERSAGRAARPGQPAIISRTAWGANESIVRARPYYAERVAFSVVHHTAGAQPASPEQSAAIVRGIQAYHVQGNGWNDIGYNFLVDRFGQIFEGRGGGIDSPVVGAHALGFNTGSVGVAVLGSFSGSRIPTTARSALVRLLAWRLDRAHVNPTSKVLWRSAGNPRHPAGRLVRLRAVSGHRDTGPTTCPGSGLWRQLGRLGRSVRAHGGTKIFRPRAKGSLGGPVRVRATVDPARSWRVTMTDGAGELVGEHAGSGPKVAWTWDSSAALPATYRWVVSAGDAYEGTGLVGSGGVPPPAPGEVLRVLSASAARRVLSPNGDGWADRTVLRWRTSIAAEVRITVFDEAGQIVGHARDWRVVPPGAHRAAWNGTTIAGAEVSDGLYTLRIRARAGKQSDTREIRVKLDRTLGSVGVKPKRFSPNGDGRKDVVETSFVLARGADVELRAKPSGSPAETVFSRHLAAGAHTLVWDGSLNGSTASDGVYKLVLAATSGLGTRKTPTPVSLDTKLPRVTNLAARRVRRGTLVTFRLDEAGPARIMFGETTVRVAGRVGRNRVWRRLRVDTVSVRSSDGAGNRSALETTSVGP